jgi:alkaline phosphatase D
MKPLLCAILFACAICQQPVWAQGTLPANLYPDTDHAPFLWGVASGDPLPASVLIWTRPDPEATNGGAHTLQWAVATDEAMTQVVASGQTIASATNDHCVTVDVSGLMPSTTYHYRFTSANGDHSATGRTRTAPVGSAAQLKIAVASCSSLFSGFFNAYARIAEREDLDLVIHLGDYIYDFVDPDEEVRVPSPYPTDPETEDEWRERHRLYLLDPDLRAARQMHPWVVTWDNHDFNRTSFEGFQAFWEYVPRRNVHDDISKIYRNFSYGDLVDLTVIDIQQYRNRDTLAPGENSTMGNQQRAWYLNTLGAQSAKWRITANQKMFGGWYSEGIPSWIPVPNDGGVFSRGSWDGFQAERDSILRFIQENGIDNFMVISGDAHMSFAMDLSRAPKNGSVYHPATGNGSLGVEFLPTSITRGNFDESGVPAFAVPIFESASNGINPHHRYTEFTKHGYGLLHIDHDSIVAEWWYSGILSETLTETLGKRMTVGDRQNRWKRASGFAPLDVAGHSLLDKGFQLYPNPTTGLMDVSVQHPASGGLRASVIAMDGRTVLELGSIYKEAFSVDVHGLSAGTYVLLLQSEQAVLRRPFVRQ